MGDVIRKMENIMFDNEHAIQSAKLQHKPMNTTNTIYLIKFMAPRIKIDSKF